VNRNMDIVRDIILAVRESSSPVNSIPNISPSEFAYHAQLLVEAGLIVAAIMPEGGKPARSAMIFRLTWTGHDFADSIVDDTIWKKAKDNVIKPTASWTFGILLEYLKVEIQSHIPGLNGPL
jgi:hypothetical protein